MSASHALQFVLDSVGWGWWGWEKRRAVGSGPGREVEGRKRGVSGWVDGCVQPVGNGIGWCSLLGNSFERYEAPATLPPLPLLLLRVVHAAYLPPPSHPSTKPILENPEDIERCLHLLTSCKPTTPHPSHLPPSTYPPETTTPFPIHPPPSPPPPHQHPHPNGSRHRAQHHRPRHHKEELVGHSATTGRGRKDARTRGEGGNEEADLTPGDHGRAEDEGGEERGRGGGRRGGGGKMRRLWGGGNRTWVSSEYGREEVPPRHNGIGGSFFGLELC